MAYQIVFLFMFVILLMIFISSFIAEKKDRRPQDHDPLDKDNSDMF